MYKCYILCISYKKKKLGGFFSRLSLAWITVIDTWSYTGINKMTNLFLKLYYMFMYLICLVVVGLSSRK